GRCPRRGAPPQGDDQHDGRSALVVCRRGDARGARGRHRGKARRPGAGEGRIRRLEGPDRQRQHARPQPREPAPQHRTGHPGPRPTPHSSPTRRSHDPVDVRGEVLRLKETINTMVDQLSSFADEVTRVAREVGTEGKLGGQAQVEGVSGVWKGLTDNVNSMALSLTSQVRAIAAVSTAVTQGDLTRSIAVEAQGEVAELKDTINQMIANLRETTERNSEQDWLNSNLARFGGMMQGQRDLRTVSNLIMSELTPLVSAQFGAFYLVDDEEGSEPLLRLLATYGYHPE